MREGQAHVTLNLSMKKYLIMICLVVTMIVPILLFLSSEPCTMYKEAFKNNQVSCSILHPSPCLLLRKDFLGVIHVLKASWLFFDFILNDWNWTIDDSQIMQLLQFSAWVGFVSENQEKERCLRHRQVIAAI